MADPQKKPEPFPPALEPDEEEEEEPKSTLPDPVVEREAERAIEEIEEEIEEEHPSRPARPPPAPRGPEKTFLDQSWELQYRVENRIKRIGHGRYGRVIKMARKPEEEEFRKAAQITGIGIMVIGAFGFGIFLLMRWIMSLLNVK